MFLPAIRDGKAFALELKIRELKKDNIWTEFFRKKKTIKKRKNAKTTRDNSKNC